MNHYHDDAAMVTTAVDWVQANYYKWATDLMRLILEVHANNIN